MSNFSWGGFFLRWIFAAVLVFASYNAFEYSYLHWLQTGFTEHAPLKALAGVLLVIGWVIYLRATVRSLNLFGMMLATAVVGILIWCLFYYTDLKFEVNTLSTTLIQAAISWVLAIGMSWSHVRRKLSGQVDTDDLED